VARRGGSATTESAKVSLPKVAAAAVGGMMVSEFGGFGLHVVLTDYFFIRSAVF